LIRVALYQQVDRPCHNRSDEDDEQYRVDHPYALQATMKLVIMMLAMASGNKNSNRRP